MKQFLRSWKYSIPTGIVAAAVLGWLVFGFFGFHLLFVDDEVDEALPAFSAPAAVEALVVAEPSAVVTSPAASAPAVPATTLATAAPAPAAPVPATDPATTDPATTVPPTTVPPTPPVIVTEATGSFVSLDHPTAGEVLVLGDGSGERFLRFEDLATDNGPDLKVYLVNSAAGGAGDPANVVDLGTLKGNIGDQNYEIPVGTDLSTFDTVVIWCVRFSSPFGEAVLVPA